MEQMHRQNVMAPSSTAADLPLWVPQAARHYLAHTAQGQPIRELARHANVHASTVLRQVRRYESRRNDPLVDDAFRLLTAHIVQAGEDASPVVAQPADAVLSDAEVMREATRVLRRLCETGAVLAVARDMEMGVVVRDDGPHGAGTTRLAVVSRDLAQALALQDWILPDDPAARIVRYHITAAGRAALLEMIAVHAKQGAARHDGFAESRATFEHGDGEDVGQTIETTGQGARNTMAESPLTILARRKGPDGKPFLGRDLVGAGERLREDYELAHLTPRMARHWDRYLCARATPQPGEANGRVHQEAKARVVAALRDLGPGLGDVALRCCCLLEGMEQLERRMGWSARSGKIVLRIALQHLRRHYLETQGPLAPRIG